MKTKTIILALGLAALLIYGITQQTSGSFSPGAPDALSNDPQVGTDMGNLAPPLAYENPKGEVLELKDLRGKVVLIDFWASWCGPCRRENPNVVEAYNKYHDAEFTEGSGFTVYGVSLDRNKSSWKKAIEADNLKWNYHVSDLKGWSSEAAAKYGVRAIPSNYLIDEDGIIIGKNLRGNSLHKALENIKE